MQRSVSLGLRVAALITDRPDGEELAGFILKRFSRAFEYGYPDMTVADAEEAFDLYEAAQSAKARRLKAEASKQAIASGPRDTASG